MRYVIQFVDKTFRIVTENAGRGALASLAAGKPIIIGDNGYSSHYISAIKPLPQWAEEMGRSALGRGKKFCRYGVSHDPDDRCQCRDSLEPLWERDEVKPLISSSNAQALASPPETIVLPIELQKAKQAFISSHSLS